MIARVVVSKPPKASHSNRATRFNLFGPPPLIEGEDTAAYDEILTSISTDIKPRDIIEDVLLRDVVDITWDIMRLRRIKVGLMTAAAALALGELASEYIETSEAEELANGWVAGTPSAIKQVDELLASSGKTKDIVMAEVLTNNLDHIERIERLTAVAEARRNAALRELERHRTTFVHALRESVRQFENRTIEATLSS